MYITLFNKNNLLLSEAVERNSCYMKNLTFNMSMTHSIVSFSSNEFTGEIKSIFFLFLLFHSSTFNEIKFRQMLLSSGTKQKELVHKSILTINYIFKQSRSHFNTFFCNSLLLLNLLIYACRFYSNLYFLRLFKGLYLNVGGFDVKNTGISSSTPFNQIHVYLNEKNINRKYLLNTYF